MYLLWLRVAAVLYAAAGLTVFPAVLYGVERWRKSCVHFGGMALFFHFVSLVEMLIQGHHIVPVGFTEMESVLGFVIACLFFLVWWIYDAISLGVFALPATFFVVFVPAIGPDHHVFPSNGVRISWLVAHILALLLAYAALSFSLLSSMLYLVQERRIKSKLRPGARSWLPPLDTLERVALATLEFGFPCMTIGLLIGVVLAQESALGAAYFTDPKVLASFASWGFYVLLLYVRRSAGLRGRKAAYVSGAVLVAVMVVWVANLFSHVHRFGVQ